MFPPKYFGEYSPVIWGVRQILPQAPAHSQWQRHLLEVPRRDKSIQGGYSCRDPLLHTVSITPIFHVCCNPFGLFLVVLAGKTNFSLDHLPSSLFASEKNVGIYFKFKQVGLTLVWVGQCRHCHCWLTNQAHHKYGVDKIWCFSKI